MMTSDRDPDDSESDSSGFVRPRFSMPSRHYDLIEKLADLRYASRSEAVRAAVVSHANSVLENGETTWERLFQRMEELGSQLSEIEETLEELQQLLEASLRAKPTASTPESASQELPDAVGAKNEQNSTEIEDTVYRLLTENGPMTVSSLAESGPDSTLEVRDALERLVDRGFVTSSADGGTLTYRVTSVDE